MHGYQQEKAGDTRPVDDIPEYISLDGSRHDSLLPSERFTDRFKIRLRLAGAPVPDRGKIETMMLRPAAGRVSCIFLLAIVHRTDEG